MVNWTVELSEDFFEVRDAGAAEGVSAEEGEGSSTRGVEAALADKAGQVEV